MSKSGEGAITAFYVALMYLYLLKKPLLAHASLHEVLSMELHFKIKNIYNSQYKCQYKSPHKSKFANLLTYVNIQIAIV